MLEQWLVNRAARQQEAARAATGAKPLADGEGPPLIVPGLIWADPNRHLHGWQPPEVPTPADPREVERRAHTDELKAEAVAQIDPALVEVARRALDASAAAHADVSRLEQEKRDLVEPLTEQQVLRSLVIDRQIATARKAAEQADMAVEPALLAMRAALSDAFAQIYQREYLVARRMDEQAEQIEIAAGDIRLSVANARSALENYLPPEPEAPPPAPVRRKRLFERKIG